MIHRYYQRWPTEELYKRLYWDYFRTLSLILIFRCEVIGTERRLMKLQDYLVKNLQELTTKEALLHKITSSLRRKTMIRYRRSELGRRLFKRTRRTVLTRFFQGLVR